MAEIVEQQYAWIRSARQQLFAFLEEIPQQKLHETVPGFGLDTMIGAHIHAADSYKFWIASFAFQLKSSDVMQATDDEIARSGVNDVRDRFNYVDEIVQKFMAEYRNHWFEDIERTVEWQDEPCVITPLRLLTHTMTHEFHHKGQILSMARHIGYPPRNFQAGGLFS